MKNQHLDKDLVCGLLIMALAEDIGYSDITSESVIPPDAKYSGALICKADGVICGMTVVQWLFELLDKKIRVRIVKPDGSKVKRGTIIGKISGPAQQILAGERTALNILQHLSGIATLTAQYVAAIKGAKAKILDTRKTLPGLRMLEKYAVVCGGGQNHRMGLYDAVMIKDNHIAIGKRYGHNIANLVELARKNAGLKTEIIVEVASLEQLKSILPTIANVILLDNMDEHKLRAAAKFVQSLPIKQRPLLEASGGVNLKTVRAIAKTGVNRISVGAITHSAPALDISLDEL